MTSTRKMISFVMTSLDGCHEGPDHSIDWHNAGSGEFNRFAVQQLDEMDVLVFGRVTYELMAGYWPTQAARDDDPEVAARMNALPKVVVSRTFDHVTWANTDLVRDRVAERLTELRRQPGKDITIFGSSNLGKPPAFRPGGRGEDHGESGPARPRNAAVPGRGRDRPEPA